jgi:phosphoglycerol transferase MdoB-like AlkP superfamily enzyme
LSCRASCLKWPSEGVSLPLVLFLGAFLITLGFYTLQRFQFLLWNWSFYHSQPLGDLVWAFVLALRFDLAAVSLLSALPFLIFVLVQLVSRGPLSIGRQRLLLIVFVLFHFPTMVLNLGDAEFINFLGRRYTFDALFFFREIPGKFWDITFYYWKLNLINISILGLFMWAVVGWLPRRAAGFQPRRQLKKKLTVSALVFVVLAVSARGGLQSKPLNFAHARDFLNPMMNNLVLNSSFTFLQTIKRDSLPRDHFFTSEEMLQHLLSGLQSPSLLEGRRPSQRPNIVLIILESFGLEYVGYANRGQGYTPFLDELASKGIFFSNAFANARRSIEGVGAIMGGIPALMNEPFISSQYLTNHFLGAGTWLEKAGYHTSFFHGAQNGSMYFDQFMRSAGVQNYFGKNEYPNPQDSDGAWGIWDEPFLQWSATQMKSFPQPFFATIFTLSSHNPFKIPEKYQSRFPKGTMDVHESIGYTDHSLRQFFKSIEREPWYSNTIFILTADHTYKHETAVYQNEMGNYRVPLLIYSPGVKLPDPDATQVVQHIDILPTLLDLAGLPENEKNYLGTSVFVPGNRFAVNYSDGRYLFITRDFFLSYSRGGEAQMFAMSDPGQTKPLLAPEAVKSELEKRLKASIQYFSQGMWDNKLYYPSGR